MTQRETRTRLIRKLARGADTRRLARVLDRLTPGDLEATLTTLDALELRRAAAVLLGPERLDATLDAASDLVIVRLIFGATDADACRALRRMPAPRAASVVLRVGLMRRDGLLEALDAELRTSIVKALPRAHRPKKAGEHRLGGVFRLRRLFA